MPFKGLRTVRPRLCLGLHLDSSRFHPTHTANRTLILDNFVVVSVLSDAQTLSEVAVSLEMLILMVSHTDCTALSTVCSLPGVKRLGVTVRSDVKASP